MMPNDSPSPAQIVTELPNLPRRAVDGHKGNYGKVLIVAGSRGMSGAAILSGIAALRGGAGLVQVAVPSDIQAIVAAGHPCYTTAGLACDDHGRFALPAVSDVLALASAASAVVLGPGLGQSDQLRRFVAELLERCDRPMVVDADGLNAIAPLRSPWLAQRSAATILTPHPGEMARLLGISTSQVQADRSTHALQLAQQQQVIVVLKGAGTLVSDGRRWYRNPTGNPGMATGGTGDVLTGLIAALIGQGLSAYEAAQLGVYLHGRAGDLAAEVLGEVSLTASDLLDYLPKAIRERERLAATEVAPPPLALEGG